MVQFRTKGVRPPPRALEFSQWRWGPLTDRAATDPDYARGEIQLGFFGSRPTQYTMEIPKDGSPPRPMPQPLGTQPARDEGTCQMRAVENMLQVNFNLAAWEFRNVLAFVYRTSLHKISRPRDESCDIWYFKERRDVFNRDGFSTLGISWTSVGIELLLNEIGLRTRFYKGAAEVAKAIASNPKFALLSVDRDFGDRRDNGHSFCISNGYIVDSAAIQLPDHTFIFNTVVRWDGTLTAIANYGRGKLPPFTLHDVLVVDADDITAEEGWPVFNLIKLQVLLHRTRHIDPHCHGDTSDDAIFITERTPAPPSVVSEADFPITPFPPPPGAGSDDDFL
jgi:hypothetical protein